MKPDKIIIFLLLFAFIQNEIYSQAFVKTYKAPVLSIDFGNADNNVKNNVGSLPFYRKTNSNCPNDGEYSFSSFTKGCFGDRWIFVGEDHTAGDKGGKMMVVNASQRPGTFFMYAVKNLIPNSHYEFSVWITNVCRTASECIPNPPNITFTIQNIDGKPLARFKTGNVTQTGFVNWKRYSGEFIVPSDADAIIIKLDDETSGGCGNDFAIDDMMLREFTLDQPQKETPEVNKPIAAIEKSKPIKVTESAAPALPPTIKKEIVIAQPEKETIEPKEVFREINVPKSIPTLPKTIDVPKLLVERSSPIAKQIQIEAGEMLIELYDNGQIDGDTVTVYDNNILLEANAGLSTKPVRIKIKVNKDHPHHEIVMVANNLGSIPPNTSMMIITANGVRYEIFISSSEEKNAQVVIDLKE